jgi:hypothetical protein
VTVYQKSRSIWVAIGSYEGEYIERMGHCETAAVGSWRQQATRIGKDGSIPSPLHFRI